MTKTEKILQNLEKHQKTTDNAMQQSEQFKKEMQELEKKEKLSWREKWATKKLLKRFKKAIATLEESSKQEESDILAIKDKFATAIMELDDIFEMEDEGIPLTKELLLTKDVDELSQIMKDGVQELQKIVGETA